MVFLWGVGVIILVGGWRLEVGVGLVVVVLLVGVGVVLVGF